MDNDFDEDILLRKGAIIAAMTRHGIDTIVVEYSGSGDSGQIDDITFSPAHEPSYVDFDNSATPLRAFVEEFADDLIDSRHSGYENNDGGQGTITIARENASVTWEHSDFYTESDTTEYAL